MTDIQAWLDEARALADQATEGPWEADGHEITQHWSRPEPWQTIVGAEVACMAYCYGGSAEGVESDKDAAFIADARTRLPQALNAIQAVLDLHKPEEYDGYPHSPDGVMCAVCLTEYNEYEEWPCPTVRAIQNAIKEQDA